jgi:hypothetical protein
MVESGKKIIPLKYAEMVDDRMNREVEEKKVDETKKQFSLDGQDTKSNIRSI